MAGGPSTPELVAAVARAGGLGSLAAGYLTPEALADAIDQVKRGNDAPFSVNVFVLPKASRASSPFRLSDRAHEVLERLASELGIEQVPRSAAVDDPLEEQIDVILDRRIPIVSFTFGLLEAELVSRLHGRDVVVMGTATCVEEGRRLQSLGCDAVVAQGIEAGGHRGSFLEGPLPQVATLPLVAGLVAELDIPVIASGGIMNGAGIAAALSLGAGAAQLGTAFLVTTESGATPEWKRRVLESSDLESVVTPVFSGKPARGLRNAFIAAMEPFEAELPPYPEMNAITGELRRVARAQGRDDYQSLWAGQAGGLGRTLGAQELVELLVSEAGLA